MYKIILAAGVQEQISGLSQFVRSQIEAVLIELARDPYSAYSALRMSGGGLVARSRCKVGDHRVIYHINDDRVEVYILKVGNRKTVYQK